MEIVSVDNEICGMTAELIRNLQLRGSFYERPYLKVESPEEIRLRGYFYSVAICHQTYQLHNEALGLYGWDYLEHVFTQLMLKQDWLLLPGSLSSVTNSKLTEILAKLFSPDEISAHTTLDRLEERAGMLIELDQFVAEKFEGSLIYLMEQSGSKLFNNGYGFYEILPNLQSFTDPLRKKITFLLKLIQEAGLINILDPGNFIPIMDYHMQRVLLRMGCVKVNDQNLRKQLIDHQPLQTDEMIRKSCIVAFRIISEKSGYAVTKMNDFFWSLGRSCCNQHLLCQTGICEKKPCTFFQIVDLKEHNDCYFKSVCKGFSDISYRQLWQPMVETHYY